MSSSATFLVQDNDNGETVLYQTGFGNTFESEAKVGALPIGRNNPRKVPFDLYTEQLSGTAFTSPRSVNQRTWLYRQQPSVVSNVKPFQCSGKYFGNCDPTSGILDPNPMRWSPFEQDDCQDKDFCTGAHLLGASGDPATKNGLAIYVYIFQKSMDKKYLYNSDGDWLLVPQQGVLKIRTEVGRLVVCPGEICVLPRGIQFSVHVDDETTVTRGYMIEIYKGHFTLPELGPIGANGLANARDFLYPVAWYEDEKSTAAPFTLINKFGSQLWTKQVSSSPFNVVAWHGNYLPFKYNLARFCAVNSVNFDHLDPSIYTVLTAVGDEPGTALCDFVIFPPRWMSTDENTFRPPWFHRNAMTEFMGLIYGSYDAKQAFLPGGASLHSCMTPHGPDATSYDKAVADPCERPTKFSGGLAFMFETSCALFVSKAAREHPCLETTYGQCWKELPNRFSDADKKA
jgi:homogentisate 1,2-dioxygenase